MANYRFIKSMLVPSSNPLAAGVKLGAGISGVAIVFNSSVGKFTLSAELTKKLSVQNGDYLMFTTNEPQLNLMIQTKDPDYIGWCNEVNGDPDSAATRAAFLKECKIYFIAKGFAKVKDNGDPVLVNATVTPAEKKAYFEAHKEELWNDNKELAVAEWKKQAEAAGVAIPEDEDGNEDTAEIERLAKEGLDESCVQTKDVETAQIQAYTGSKLATVGGSGGVGYQLNGSDKNIWTDLKAEVEPNEDGTYDPMYLDETGAVNPAKFNRQFKVLEEDAAVGEVKNGNRTEQVLWYPIVKDDNSDSVPEGSFKKKA